MDKRKTLQRKISSALELSQFKVGQLLYWVTMRTDHVNQRSKVTADEWMTHCHPKVFYDRGLRKLKRRNWAGKLPALHAVDFGKITDLVSSKLVVEEFVVCSVLRSNDTGEFLYSNRNDEYIPEAYVFLTRDEAAAELHRICANIGSWVGLQVKA